MTNFEKTPDGMFPRRPRLAGFTLIELLVVLAIIAILAALLLPALSRAKKKAIGIQCLSNNKQLALAWGMYADDFSEQVVDAGNDGDATRVVWITGQMTYTTPTTLDPGNPSNWDPRADLFNSPLWNYAGKVQSIFRCPADARTAEVGGKAYPAVRSISMNQAFMTTSGWISPWRLYKKRTQIVRPVNTFVFVEEAPASLNDAAFATSPSTAINAAGIATPDTAEIPDFPAVFHGSASAFAFSDGHAEIHRWIGSTIQNCPFTATSRAGTVPAGDSGNDVVWMALNTSVYP